MSNIPVRLKVDRKALAAFRRRALQDSNEVYAYLFGHTKRVGGQVVEVDVQKFLYPKTFLKRTPNEILTSPEEDKRILAEAAPLEYLGSIHSHPESITAEAVPSTTDVTEASKDGSVIYGIFSFWTGPKRKQSHLNWFLAAPPLLVKLK